MSKRRVSLEMDVSAFRRIVLSRATLQRVADCYGVTRQSVHSWMVLGRIPPRAMANITNEFSLSPEEVKQVLAPQRQGQLQVLRSETFYARRYRRLKKLIMKFLDSVENMEAMS